MLLKKSNTKLKHSTKQHFIRIKDISKSYRDGNHKYHVLESICLDINQGDIISIIGPSGCGKTTFLNLLGGLDKPDSGHIYMEDQDITQYSENQLCELRNQSIGFIFQSHYLIPDFSAIENVMLPYLNKNFDKKKAYEEASNLFCLLKLEDKKESNIFNLSGGEQQRVAIARAIINRPKLLLADEATGNLDANNTHQIQQLLWQMQEHYHLTIILVTHNEQLAKKAKRQFKLDYGKLHQLS